MSLSGRVRRVMGRGEDVTTCQSHVVYTCITRHYSTLHDCVMGVFVRLTTLQWSGLTLFVQQAHTRVYSIFKPFVSRWHKVNFMRSIKAFQFLWMWYGVTYMKNIYRISSFLHFTVITLFIFLLLLSWFNSIAKQIGIIIIKIVWDNSGLTRYRLQY